MTKPPLYGKIYSMNETIGGDNMNVYRIQAHTIRPTSSGIARVQVFNVRANSKKDAEAAVRKYAKDRGYIAILGDKKF